MPLFVEVNYFSFFLFVCLFFVFFCVFFLYAFFFLLHYFLSDVFLEIPYEVSYQNPG